jgi:hypothetical protein
MCPYNIIPCPKFENIRIPYKHRSDKKSGKEEIFGGCDTGVGLWRSGFLEDLNRGLIGGVYILYL